MENKKNKKTLDVDKTVDVDGCSNVVKILRTIFRFIIVMTLVGALCYMTYTIWYVAIYAPSSLGNLTAIYTLTLPALVGTVGTYMGLATFRKSD